MTERRDFVHAAGEKGFALVPISILHDGTLSVGARVTYAEMLFRAWKAEVLDDSEPPPLDELAGTLGVGLTAVKGYVRELRDRGLVESKRRGRGLPNSYVVFDSRKTESVSLESRNPTARKPESDRPRAGASETGRLKRKKEVRANARTEPELRDPVWDALAKLYGEPTTKTETTNRGRVVREIRRGLAASPNGDIGPRTPVSDEQAFGRVEREIRTRVLALGRHWDDPRKVTENALVKNWTLATRLAETGRSEAPRDPDAANDRWLERVGYSIEDEEDVRTIVGERFEPDVVERTVEKWKLRRET